MSLTHKLNVFTKATGPPSATITIKRNTLTGMTVIQPSCGFPEVSMLLLPRREVAAASVNHGVRVLAADFDAAPFAVASAVG
jgi:hypothetical protein